MRRFIKVIALIMVIMFILPIGTLLFKKDIIGASGYYKVGNNSYGNLQEAIDASSLSNPVVLLADVEINQQVTVIKDTIIDLNEHRIDLAIDNSSMFNINNSNVKLDISNGYISMDNTSDSSLVSWVNNYEETHITLDYLFVDAAEKNSDNSIFKSEYSISNTTLDVIDSRIINGVYVVSGGTIPIEDLTLNVDYSMLEPLDTIFNSVDIKEFNCNKAWMKNRNPDGLNLKDGTINLFDSFIDSTSVAECSCITIPSDAMQSLKYNIDRTSLTSYEACVFNASDNSLIDQHINLVNNEFCPYVFYGSGIEETTIYEVEDLAIAEQSSYILGNLLVWLEYEDAEYYEISIYQIPKNASLASEIDKYSRGISAFKLPDIQTENLFIDLSECVREDAENCAYYYEIDAYDSNSNFISRIASSVSGDYEEPFTSCTWNNLTASWDGIPDAEGYRLFLTRVDTFYEIEESPLFTADITDTSYDFSSIIPPYGDGCYIFGISALDNEGKNLAVVCSTVDYFSPTPTPTSTPTPTPTSTPTSTPTPTPSSDSGVEGFVERLYEICYGRPSDEGGKTNWVNNIGSGIVSGGDAGRFFCISQEMINQGLSNEAYVESLYRVFFDRASDPVGRNYWLERLNSGASREDIIDGFVNSVEWANVCFRFGINSGGTAVHDLDPSPEVIGFLNRFYSVALGRSGDPTGLDDWGRDLINGRKTATEVAYGIIFSEEFIGFNLSNEEYVERLYLTFMDRGSDEVGRNHWMGLLNEGASREEVFFGFAASNEFRGICESFGISNC